MDRKEAIIFSARKQFTRFGYTKTTMDEIARECGITKPTLYQHYAGKADLFAAVIDHEQTAFFAMIDQATVRTVTASEKLRIYAQMQVEAVKKFLLLGELSRHALLDLHPEALKVMAICRQREEGRLAAWIEEGVASGEFASTDAQFAARIFFLAVISLRFQILVLDNVTVDTITADEVPVARLASDLERLVDLFLNGFLARS
ncbi:MAG TPA: TetR/AcrR family transcriptional regulator [Smithellaceae bacterium]|nr:TetR/AcrR family transcriptional regulator [Smithellaceae bacterium]